MLIAVKGNKQLKIDEAEKQTYLKLGYDIAKAKGDKLEVIQKSPTATVPYVKYKELKIKYESLKKQLKKELTVDEIKAQLDELGIEYGAKDNKDTLMSLLNDATK